MPMCFFLFCRVQFSRMINSWITESVLEPTETKIKVNQVTATFAVRRPEDRFPGK